jgi:DNA-binding NarL/FixJ family response regulator
LKHNEAAVEFYELREFMIRIFIVDDNALIRSHLRVLLEQHTDWVVVGEASNGRDAIVTCQELKPDLTVMDFLMPGMDGLEAARHLSRQDPRVQILMVTVDPSRQLEVEARKAGIRGLCAKTQIWNLADAVESLIRGRTYFSAAPAAA